VPASEVRSVTVVGAGLAGLQTVVALRQRGYAGRLTMLGAEPHRPYDRPPLSKAVLLGDAEDSGLDVDWPALDVDLRLGEPATSLDEVRSAGAVVLATGAIARTLPGAPEAGALTLHTVEDCRALRGQLVRGARVVVVGAGWIGAEVATAARRRGADVTVVEAGATPVPAALPAEVGRRMVGWYAEGGARLLLGSAVVAVEPGAVHLTDGTELRADVVVVGIGARPDTGWLAGSDVALDAEGRVEADSSLRTSVAGVVAAGACASWPSARYGRRLSMEHWDHALHSPLVAAATTLGEPATYDPVPYVWSEQWGRVFQQAGQETDAAGLVWREAADRTWAVFWVDGQRLVAVAAVDRHRDVSQARRLMERETPVDVAALADPTVPVRMAGLAG